MDTKYFECRKCKTWQHLECAGEVVEGPRCRNCKQPMRQMQVRQAELPLRLDGWGTKEPLLAKPLEMKRKPNKPQGSSV